LSHPNSLVAGSDKMNGEFELKNGAVISTRAFKRDDFESLVVFFEGLHGESMRFSIPHYYDRARLETLTSDLERNIILLALHDDRIVGVAAIFGSSLLWLRGIGDFMTYVDQDYQNQGLGTHLTRLILEEARSKGYHRVSLEVVAENVAGIKAYEKGGFVVEGRMKDWHFGEDESYHDVLIMGIIL